MTRERRRQLLPWLALCTVYLVWGSTYLAIRVVVHSLPPMAAAGLRFTTAGLVMACVAALVDRHRPGLRQLADYALVGILLLAGGNAMVMWAETRIPSGIAALLVATVPLWLTLMDGLRPSGQRWTTRVWVGTLVGLVGVALVARPEKGVAAGHWAGVLALVTAAFVWSVGSLYAQSVPRRAPLFTAAAIEMLAGGLTLAVESRLLGEDLTRFVGAPAGAWIGLAYLCVFGSLVGFTAFAFALNELPAPVVGTYAYVNPMMAVLLGAVFLGESLSAGLLAGAVLILSSVLLTTTGRRPARQAAPSPPRPASPVAQEG